MRLYPLAFLIAFQVTVAITQRATHTHVDLKTLLQNYDPLTRPNKDHGKPVDVTSNMYLRASDALDDDLNAIELQITFRLEWNDSRLAHRSSKYISIENDNLIWTPDVFFSNSKSGFRHDILKPNVLIRVQPSGNILYSSRISLQMKCKTEAEMFPFDKVECPIIFASYGYTTEDEILLWKESTPIQISKSLGFSNFNLVRMETDYCTSRTLTGEYSCLKGILHLERKPFRTYFFYLYLPSLGLVVLSWLTFFINRKASFIVRLTLTLTFTLLMVLTCTSMWHIRPHYGYITPADIWVFVSAIFVFYAMLHYVGSRFFSCRSGSMDSESGESSNKPFLKVEEEPRSLNHSRRLRRLFQDNKSDMVARFVYPLCYIIFIIVYTATYMS